MKKMFYTKEELSKISKDELTQLTTFGPNNEFFYSELVSIENVSKGTEEFKFVFRDGEVIFTQEVKTFNDVKTGKMRYDLITKSAENAEQEIKIKDEFYHEIAGHVSTVVQNMEKDNDTSLKNVVASHESSLKDLKDEMKSAMKKVKGDSETSLDIVDRAAKKINDLDD